jgi:hypothetical protein
MSGSNPRLKVPNMIKKLLAVAAVAMGVAVLPVAAQAAMHHHHHMMVVHHHHHMMVVHHHHHMMMKK